MPQRKYIQFCRTLAEAYMSGDAEASADFYTHPLAVYYKGAVRVELDRDETVRAIESRYDRVREYGAVKIVPKLHSATPSEDGRVTLRVTWYFMDGENEIVGKSVIIFYCRDFPGSGLKIELLEFEEQAFDDPPGHLSPPGQPH